jgi:hypothetical protein
VVPAALGGDAGLVGAGALALHETHVLADGAATRYP